MHGSRFDPSDQMLLPPASREMPRVNSDRRPATRWLAEEAPVAIVYDGTTTAVVMVTPADLPDLAVGQAVDALVASQDLNRKTRAVHAAGFHRPAHQATITREDVGRHNALRKLAAVNVIGVARGSDFEIFTHPDAVHYS